MMKSVVISSPDNCTHNHFGDQIVVLFYISRLLDEGYDVTISGSWSLYKELSELFDRDWSVKFEQIKPTILVDSLFNLDNSIWKEKIIPTKIKWTGGKRMIGYSFSANWNIENKINPEWKKLIGTCYYEWVELGLPRTPKECVEIASKCKYYVGVDNGISFLMRCLSMPMILLEYQYSLSVAFHIQSEYTLCKENKDVLSILSQPLFL